VGVMEIIKIQCDLCGKEHNKEAKADYVFIQIITKERHFYTKCLGDKIVGNMHERNSVLGESKKYKNPHIYPSHNPYNPCIPIPCEGPSKLFPSGPTCSSDVTSNSFMVDVDNNGRKAR
jgi:hypothetical protein